MLLTPDQEAIRDAVRDFCQAELWPNAPRWDREHLFPKEAHQGLAELGAYGICVPEEDGGAGLDYLTLALVLEEIAAGDGGTSTAISVTNCPVNAILMRYGNARQKKQWLWPLAQGRMLGAFCLTEPQAGSDLFEHQREREVVEPGAAVFLGHADAVGTEFGQALVGGLGEGVLAVPRGRVGPQLLLCEVTHRVADGFLIGGQQHGVSLSFCRSGVASYLPAPRSMMSRAAM